MYIKLLYDFEQKEKILREKESRIKEIDKDLQIKHDIAEYQNEIEGLESAAEGFRKRKLEIERDIEENNDQLKGVEALLEGNKLKTSKEIKAAKKTRDNFIAKGDELKKTLEFTDAAIKEKEEQIKEIKNKIASLKKELKEIDEERKRLTEEIDKEAKVLRKEFEKLISVIPEDVIRKYEEIKENFPYGAIATVDEDACSNCGAILPLEVLEELKEGKGEKIIRCEVCGKILYFPK